VLPTKQFELRRKVAMLNMSPEKDVARTERAERRYMICSTPRSGSTLLADLLQGTGLAGVPMEYFNDVNMEAHCRHRGVAQFEIHRYLADLDARRTTPNHVFGMKAHYGQILHAFKGSKAGSVDRFLRSYDSFIVIERRDKLGQAVSYFRALRTGRWTSQHAAMADEQEIKLTFDATGITSALHAILSTEAAWKEALWKLGIRPHVVVYEDLAANQGPVLEGVLSAIGITERNFTLPAPRIERQRDTINADLAKAYIDFLSQARAR